MSVRTWQKTSSDFERMHTGSALALALSQARRISVFDRLGTAKPRSIYHTCAAIFVNTLHRQHWCVLMLLVRSRFPVAIDVKLADHERELGTRSLALGGVIPLAASMYTNSPLYSQLAIPAALWQHTLYCGIFVCRFLVALLTTNPNGASRANDTGRRR